mgnify:CR=1 FL=1
MNLIKSVLLVSLLASLPMLAQKKRSKKVVKAEAPLVVAVPPSDAGRGLVRISKKEIRHYSGDRGKRNYLVSKDNGKTWEEGEANSDYPINYGGIPKESPAIVRNPVTKEFMRVQPIRGFVFISKGGIDGKWGVVTKKGTLDFGWKKALEKDPKGEAYLKLGGIMRTPTFVNKNQRIIIPFHGSGTSGNSFHLSDDGGMTWTKSKTTLRSPRHQADDIDKGQRWQNLCVESTLVELKDSRLWAFFRTSQDQHYQSFSSDYGLTWTEAEPSRFYGQCTMQTIFRMRDGRLISSWTNSQSLPENKTAAGRWEDAFTNRDAHHLAISEDDGKTWFGFREIALDKHRNREDYAHYHGSEDRGKHQSEIIQLSKNKILISLGQHSQYRRLKIIDLKYLYEKKRSNKFENGLEEWTVHSYIPQKKGHCSYNRKQGSFLTKDKTLQIRRLDDPSLVDAKKDVDYQNSGASWNFPNGKKGAVSLVFKMDKDNQGTQISLTDRLFNACDTTTKKRAMYSLKVQVGKRLGSVKLRANKEYRLTFRWNGVEEGGKCHVLLDGKKVTTVKLIKPSPNGVSYVHLVSTATTEDQGLYLKSVKAFVK